MMLRKKSQPKKEFKRIRQRKVRKLYQIFLTTLAFSCIAILLAIIFTKKPFIISPLPLFSKTVTTDVDRRIQLELQKQKIIPQSIESDSDKVVIKLSDDEEVILLPDQDIAKQLASLQLITRQLTMEGKRFSRLDLRFDKPVIVTR